MSIARILVVAMAAIFLSTSASAGMTVCQMSYILSGWSAFYKTYKGSGTVTCSNGQSAAVRIVSKGGGVTFGKSEIEGHGIFSEARDIGEIFGTYVSAGAHAGATKSVEAWSMTKGEVSLALTGKGRGVDLGFSFGSFTIQPQ